MNRAERKRRAKEDEKLLQAGIDPETRDAEPTAAMARQLHALFATARRERFIDPPVKYFHAKLEATLKAGSPVAVACAKGCSHCCHAWVSATAPEVLYLAKRIRKAGSAAAVERVRAAYLATRDYDFGVRHLHPHPCPMLEADLCSVYDWRPAACRFASSADANACFRALRQLLGATIPVPMRHMKARGVYEIAMVIALHQAELPHRYYELNDALTRALSHDDAEAAWLGGEDVFAGARLDPNDALASQTTQLMYRQAFG